MRRRVVVALAAVSVLAASASANADEPETSFSARTDPAPAATFAGSWQPLGEGNWVLTTTGANADATRTATEGLLTTGWTAVTGPTPLLASRIVTVDQRRATAGASHIDIHVRYRIHGKPWTEWKTRSYRLNESANTSQISPPVAGLGLAAPNCVCRVQAQWRVTTTVTGTVSQYVQFAVRIAAG